MTTPSPETDGKDAGKPQRVQFKQGPREIKPHGHNCCQAEGFSLHANRTLRLRSGQAVAPQDRAGLEKLCKYLCRPAVPASRLELVDNPKDNKTIRINLKSEWAGGIHAVVVSPRDLVIRALAQIPLPFRKAIIYHGAFAGNAAIRSQIVPDGPRAADCDADTRLVDRPFRWPANVPLARQLSRNGQTAAQAQGVPAPAPG